MRFCPRPYQTEADIAIARDFSDGIKATAAVHATGLGKTILGCMAIQRYSPTRALILAHRETLVSQFRDEIVEQTGIDTDIEMGALRSESSLWGKKQVVVGSVQTQFAAGGKRMFAPDAFGLLILDEMHHYVGAKEFRKVVEHYRTNPNLKIIGLSATPNRTDQRALGQIFENVAHAFEILPAIKAGWLVGVDPKFIPVEGLDYSHIDTSCGELNGKQLDAVLEDERIEMEMIQPTIEKAWGAPERTLHGYDVDRWKTVLDGFGEPKRTLVFCKSVRQAQKFANILNRIHGGLAQMICGADTDEHKAAVKKDFKGGPLRFVTSVDVMSEGYNNPFLQMLVMARPLKSELRYKQQLGRGTRPWPGILERRVSQDEIGFLETVEERLAAIASSPKPLLTICDFVGNSGAHKIQNSVDALGGELDEDVVERAIEKAKKENRPVQELLELSAEELRAEKEAREREEEARKQRLVAKSNYKVISVNPFDLFALQPHRERGWEQGKKLSPGHERIFRVNMGLDPEKFSYGEARQLINEQFKRWKNGEATLKQCAWLKPKGYDVTGMKKEAASQIMNAWKANNWKRPVEPMGVIP